MIVRRAIRAFAGCVIGFAAIAGAAAAQDLPRVERRGQAVQLIVDGKPYIALGGELHNSSPSDAAYMAPIWDKMTKLNVRTVIGVASWELVEPQEGRFDFALVDDQIRQARARGIKLVMLWFGAYKNAESTYAPSWVRRDEKRFPRAARDPDAKVQGIAAVKPHGPTLTLFNQRLVDADARAFAALMKHIREVDQDRTVVLVQVENEVGLLGDSRDRSAAATRAWGQQVPAVLMAHLQKNRDGLRSELRDVWGRHGFRNQGTWAQVFGTDKAADEVFMAWGFGRYIDAVAKAGAAAYPLPMYANAWLGPQQRAPEPGDYPSGGPVARMIDVWQAAAPSLAFLAPDIYIEDFAGTLADFQRPSNPIFVPEARPDTGNLFVALGQYSAIGFSPFGIEDVPEGHSLAKAYGLLGTMLPQIAEAQQQARIRGFKLASGATQTLSLGGYDIGISGPRSTLGMFGPGTGSAAANAAKPEGYGLILQSGSDEFIIVGRGISPNFSAKGAVVEVDTAYEGTFVGGKWTPSRSLNGDERYHLFDNDDLRIVRIKLLRR